jgi:hypothetical protein
LVRPETVVSWHRAGFRLFWRWRSRQPGRPKMTLEIRELIRRMKADNPGWGAPRIHGELLQLRFEVSEPTVSRYLQGLKRRHDNNKAKRWLALLNNHREIITAFDFFTVPILKFRTLYCFFVIEHGRRRVLHFNRTEHPTSNWIVQQLREALPLPCPTAMFCSIAMRSSEVRFPPFWSQAASHRNERRCEALGRTGLLNVGSAVFAASCLTMSSRLTRPTFDGLGVSILPTITKTEPTLGCRRTRQPGGPSRHDQPDQAESCLSPASVVFTIATPGQNQPNRAGKSHPNNKAKVGIRSTPASIQIAG